MDSYSKSKCMEIEGICDGKFYINLTLATIIRTTEKIVSITSRCKETLGYFLNK